MVLSILVHNVHRIEQDRIPILLFTLHQHWWLLCRYERVQIPSPIQPSPHRPLPAPSLHSPKQLVVLLVCIDGDVDGGFILLHKFQEFTGVQARVAVIKILERG